MDLRSIFRLESIVYFPLRKSEVVLQERATYIELESKTNTRPVFGLKHIVCRPLKYNTYVLGARRAHSLQI